MDNKAPQDYLKEPYERVLIPEGEGTYSASISEFEGCLACGDTAEEALNNLEEVAAAWIEAELSQGRSIPPAWNSLEFSGRFALRLPKTLHQSLAKKAHRENLSLNQYIVYALSRNVGELDARDYIVESLATRVAAIEDAIKSGSMATPFPTVEASLYKLLNYTASCEGIATTDTGVKAMWHFGAESCLSQYKQALIREEDEKGNALSF